MDFTDYDIAETMRTHGGSFVSGLGALYFRADPVNKDKLRHAFHEYFKEYRELAELLYNARRASKEPQP